ncbi:MAG: DUF177 domain-containing protein [Micavibrio sp.]|nr:DUF177 domain-containing protein [Micavibrio sp.]
MSEAYQILENEWSHFLDVNTLEKKPLVMTISPDDDEIKRLAQRLGVIDINELKADLKILQEQGSHIIHVSGMLHAKIEQSCVVTSEPVITQVDESFESWYADQEESVSFAKKRREKESKGGHAEVRILDEQDDPEPVIDGQIDLGELVTQYLSLSIDPYPHAEGVERSIDEFNKDGDDAVKPNNPFAALKDWKGKI